MTKKCEICLNECEIDALFCVRCGTMFGTCQNNDKLLAHLDAAYCGIVHRDYYFLLHTLNIIKHFLSENPNLFQLHRSQFDSLICALDRLGCDSRPFEWFAFVESFLNSLPENIYPELRVKLHRYKTLFELSESLNLRWKDKPVSAKKAIKIINSESAKLGFSANEVHQAIFGTPQVRSRVAEALDSELYDQLYALQCALNAKECIGKDEDSEAGTWIEKALNVDHNCFQAHEIAADLFLKQNARRATIESLRKAIEMGSEKSMTYNNLAWYICETDPSGDDLQEALSLARKAVELAPLAFHWDTLAEVHERLNNIPASMAACTRSILLADLNHEDIYKKRMRRLCLALELKKQVFTPQIQQELQDTSIACLNIVPPASAEPSEEASANAFAPTIVAGMGSPSVLQTETSKEAELSGGLTIGAPSPPPPSAGAPEQPALGGLRMVPYDDECEVEAGPPLACGRLAHRTSKSHSLLRPFKLLFFPVILLKDMVGYIIEWADERAEKRKEKTEELPSDTNCKLDSMRIESSKVDIEDPVDCTVFSPSEIARGQTVLVQVFAHMPEQKDEAMELAKEFDENTSRRGFKSLGLRVKRGSRLMFHLVIPSFVIDETIQELNWNGRAEAVQFEVFVPEGCKIGDVIGTVTASIDTVPVGHVKFKIKVVADVEQIKSNEVLPTGDEKCRYHKAFISYASSDRDEVLSRVQMLKSLGIDFFQDILDIEPGTRWEAELYKHIDQCDLFLLFWSSAARDSEWVMKEVRYAMSKLDGQEHHSIEIRPVIIEGPPMIPPPDELAHLHFNDKLIYLMKR